MRSKLGCFIFLMIMMTSQIFAGDLYYVEATNGNDLNDGLSEVSAWKTIAKVNAQSFSAGDYIFFKRGEIWREQLIVRSSGNAGNPITFGAYGTGADPIVSGMREVTGWDTENNWSGDQNIWIINLANDPNRLVIDGTEYLEAETVDDVDATHRWFYDSGNTDLYLYATENPAAAYSSMYYSANVDGIKMDGKSYITIQDLEVQGGAFAIKVVNVSSNILIHDCTVGKYTYIAGIRLRGLTSNPYTQVTDVEIYNNIVDGDYHNSADDYTDLRDGIWLGDSVVSCKVYNNTVTDWTHSGIVIICTTANCETQFNEIYLNTLSAPNTNYFRGIDISDAGTDGQAAYNKVYRNLIFDTTVRNQPLGDHNEFYYNVIHTVTQGLKTTGVPGGIGMFASGGKNCHDNKIYNNIIYNVADHGISADGWAGWGDVQSNLFRNNLVMNWGAGKYGIFIRDHAKVLDNTYQNNLLYKSGVSDVVYYGHDEADDYPHTITEFNAENGTASDVIGNNIGSDPLFVDAANGNFALQITSPSIDAGTYVGLIEDYAGNVVPYGWGVDIGAYEYTGISPLDAEINASPTSGWVPLNVNFTGSATGGVLPYSYSWDFGDGTSSSEQTPIHTYSQSGDYTVTLTVTDSESNQDNDSLIINASAIIAPLQASFIASPTSGEVPLTVNFTGNATGGVLPYSYSWDFGDGTSSSEQNPSHTYSEAGDYTVYLTVTDSDSNQDSDSLTINASATTSSPYLSCSPKSLYFGATTSGNETTDQYLRIINAGGGTLTWNIEDDAGWLSCSPSSGTDRGEIIVSVNASGLSLGLYVATITVSSPEAYNSPQYVSVNFRIYEPEQENPPFGSLDTPVNGSTVSGSIPITGWALDDIEVIRLEIKRNSDPLDLPEAIGSDGLVYIGDAVFVEGARPDVEKSYTDYPLNSRAGWGYMLLTNDLPYRGNGSFTIHGFAYDAGGNREEIGRKTILCDNVNRVKPFGTIDTHEQGEIIRESDYINFGWALTPLPKTIPKDGSTIWVWVDGVQVGHPVYDQYREDIATLYPEYNNSQGAVGYYYIDTTQFENGAHTIAWSVMDDDGEADEIGARYFFIDNIETGSAYHGPLGLRSIYREDVEGRLRIGIKEVGKEYRPRADSDRELNVKSILNIQIEEMEPLRIVLEEGSGGNMKYIGWGENKWKALPIGSTLDREKGIFSWIPTPGFIGRYVFHFAVTDGSYLSKPLRVVVNVIPKSYD